MSVMRSMLLAASQNAWLRDHAGKYRFVRRSVSHFMPGESLDDALAAALVLRGKKIGAMFTHLGENVKDQSEARQVVDHYIAALEQIQQHGLPSEISIKLTQLGLDLSSELCYENLQKILERGSKDATIWLDMESSAYTDATLAIYELALRSGWNIGICIQAYLRRTNDDLERLLTLPASIRLVKGAYKEPPKLAFPRKQDVDENFFALAQEMLRAKVRGQCVRAAFGTHDLALIRRISDFAAIENVAKTDLEVQMLYGIQRQEQERLANAGWHSNVLIVYGTYWYAWFVRRLAERPANLWFIVRNVFAD
jgi:proline dehydrogenase